MFQRVLLASFVITMVAGVLGSFLLIRNMALIGDGIAHVTFGGVAVYMIIAGVPTLPMATFFAVVAAILIFELQDRGILEGDTAIAIMMTGALAFGLVALRIWGEGITANVERFLYGNVLFVDDASLDWICTVGIIALFLLGAMYKSLLATAVDPIAARVQGIPVKAIGLTFSINKFGHVASMHLIEGIIVDVLHTMIDDGPSKDVANICQCVEDFDKITRTGSLSVFLDFFSQEFDT